MKNFFLLLLSLTVFTTSHAQPNEATIKNYMNNGHAPGAALLVVKEGKWIYSKNLGNAQILPQKTVNYETVFMLASLSKTMTAVAIMQLWEKGLIDLDRDINHYLPFSVRTPSFPNDSITARMLLTHTSSIEDDWNTLGALYDYGDSPITLDSFLSNYLTPGGIYYSSPNNFSTAHPGTAYSYSNVGATLAAYLVERITGDPFSHYCDTAIFEKLCMKNASFLLANFADTTKIARPYVWDNGQYFDAGLYGYPDYPDGQMRSSITDMSRFMTMLLQDGKFEGVKVLDSLSVDYMMQQQTPVDPDQGIIFYRASAGNGDKLWGHNGGDAGVNTAMYLNRTKKTGVLVLTNGSGTSSGNADLLANHIYLWGQATSVKPTDSFPACGTILSVPQFAKNIEVDIYPNPTKGHVQIGLKSEAELKLMDVQGRILWKAKLKAGNQRFSLLPYCSPGVYFIYLQDSDGGQAVRKLILQ